MCLGTGSDKKARRASPREGSGIFIRIPWLLDDWQKLTQQASTTCTNVSRRRVFARSVRVGHPHREAGPSQWPGHRHRAGAIRPQVQVHVRRWRPSPAALRWLLCDSAAELISAQLADVSARSQNQVKE